MATSTATALKEIQGLQIIESGVWTTQEVVEKLQNGTLAYIEADKDLRSERDEKDYFEALKVYNEKFQPIIQILHPITVYQIDDNQLGILNGNSRVKALMYLWLEGKIAKDSFMPVRWENVGTVSKEMAYQYQQKSNDTTIRHSIVEKIRKADELYNYFYREAMLQKAPESTSPDATVAELEVLLKYEPKRAASKYATQKCTMAFDIKPDIFSKLKLISNSGDYILELIEKDSLKINLAYEIIKTRDELSEKNGVTFTLNSMLSSLYDLAESDGSIKRGVVKIEQRFLQQFVKRIKADSAPIPHENTEGEGGETESGENDNKGKSKKDKTPAPTYTKEEFVKISNDFKTQLNTINTEELLNSSGNTSKIDYCAIKLSNILAKAIKHTASDENAELLPSLMALIKQVADNLDATTTVDTSLTRDILEFQAFFNQPEPEAAKGGETPVLTAEDLEVDEDEEGYDDEEVDEVEEIETETLGDEF